MQTLLQINQINKSYGSRSILSDASLSIFEKQKIGVVGRNGAGKTTLLNMILGEEEIDSGEIIHSKDLRLSHLKQSVPFDGDETVMEYLMRTSHKEDWECGRIAGRFQLKNDHLYMPAVDLSGGFQMRAKLSSMLLTDPNFLILDEPTNYLDLNTLLLLEDFLKQYNAGFMVISHDREFLKNTCTSTLEVDQGNLSMFPGKIEEYMEFKEQQVQEIERINKNTDSKRKELEAFVTKFRAKASKASQAQSKLKQLNKLQTIDIDHPLKNIRIQIPSVRVRKGSAIIIEDLSAGYDDKSILDGINLNIARGSKTAILGDNGQGKSTFLKTIAGKLESISGSYSWKEEKIGFYAQHVYSSISEDLTVTDYLKQEAASDVLPQQVLDLAGSFLFSGDDAKKKVKVLSGGERGRLCLAGLLLAKNDVLLLDEPTNHLDFETVEALGFALKKFEGTVLIVSHDRTFVNLIATEIVEIDAGHVQLFPGDYQEYIYQLQNKIAKDKPSKPSKKTSKENIDKLNTGTKEKPASGYNQKKQNRVDLRKSQKEFQRVEDDIKTLEKKKEEMLSEMSSGSYSKEKNEELQRVETELHSIEEKWLHLESTISDLKKQIDE